MKLYQQYAGRLLYRRPLTPRFRVALLTLFLLTTCFTAFSQSDGLQRGSYLMPYTRYEATASALGGGAVMLPRTFDQKKTESEATDQTCAQLSTNGSFARWTTSAAGQGLVLRFSMPDAAGGGGQSGTLALYVGGSFVQNIALSSRWSWQYFSPNPGDGTKDPTNSPSPGWTARMRFDEVRVKLPSPVPAGTEIRIQKTADAITYLVDFVEIEPIPAQVLQPANYINVTTFGAVPDDNVDDMNAFASAIGEARTSGRSIYVPAGRFLLSRKLDFINMNNITFQGAGMWHTELYFSNGAPGNGGIETGGTNLHFRDFFMNTENTTRTLPYKGFTGGYGTNSTIERVWAEHFEVGAWIANWSGPSTAQTDGLMITTCRFRNNYADGVNFSKGTSNSICEHSHFRNNGDDAMATWSSFDGPACINNEFRYCTAENTWRAAGIGFFGGGGHKGHHLIIKDNVEAGIRVNSDFPGPAFSTTLWMEIYETTVISSGTNANLWFNRYGAIDIFTRLYDLQNLRLRNIDVNNSQKDAILIYTVNPSYRITNLEMINVTVNGAGRDNNINNYTSGTYDDYAGHGLLVLPNVSGAMTAQNLVISNVPTQAIKNESPNTFTINTIGNVAVTGVGISPATAVSVPVQGTAQLTANVQPSNATNQNVTWSSSATSVATVNASGLVTGVAPGTATITVRTTYGNFTATKSVTVNAAVNVTATDASAGEGGNSGVFRISTTSTTTNITVSYTVSGTATASDFSASPPLSGTVTLTPSAPAANITITPVDDNAFEGNETLIITLQPSSSYVLGGNTSATITIADNDSPPCTTPVIGFTSTAPAIDQAIDAAWNAVPGGTIGNVTFGARPSDFAGSQWRALYTSTHLFLLVEVRDAQEFNDSGANWWEDDVVEVFIDGDNSKGTSYDGVNDFQFGFRFNDPSSVKVGQNSVNRTTGINYAMQNHAQGYNVEIAIPWSTIGVTPSSGNRIGLEIAVDDDDNGGARDAQMSAFAMNGSAFTSPSVFGSVVLTTSCGGGDPVAVTGVTVSPSSGSIVVGSTLQLSASVLPANATNKSVTWSSSSPSVASVNSSGLVTGVSQGTAIITVTTQDGAKTSTSSITVTSGNVAVTGVTVSPTSVSVAAGGTAQLTATVQPTNATNRNVTWATSNQSVATVNASGLVSGISAGTATITATTQDGARTASASVTVTSSAQTPFGGSPRSIPGTIQAEDFDNGGEGVAYHDLDAVNNGGQYRSTAVDIESSTEGNYNIGWLRATEWLEYTVSVTAGTFLIDARVAATTAGKSFHIELDGVNISGPISVPNTGGWQNWQTVTVGTPALSSGTKVLRLVADSDDFNLNAITFRPQASATVYRIRNRWQNTFLYDAGDRVRYGSNASGTSYQWVVEELSNGQRELRNVGTGEYMHIENLLGYVQCTARTAGWASSRWTLQDAGSGYIRLQNVWQPSNYAHVENLAGHLQYGPINSSWMSAQWMLEPIVTSANLESDEMLTEKSMIRYWPNSVHDELYIHTDGSMAALEVVDLLGRVSVSIDIAGKKEISLDVRNLSSGVHVVRLRSPISTYSFRVVKE